MEILLETDRLLVRRITAADLDVVYALDSDPEVMRYILPPRTREQIETYIVEITRDYDVYPGFGRWLALEKATGAAIGIFMLKPLQTTPYIEVGYRMFSPFWGKGYATEGAQALVSYGFEQLHIPRIVGITYPDNTASQHVLEKCGLRFQRMMHFDFVGRELRFYAIENPAIEQE
jgi:[ribosomal protein S5]-alanine N-acetyltransferase